MKITTQTLRTTGNVRHLRTSANAGFPDKSVLHKAGKQTPDGGVLRTFLFGQLCTRLLFWSALISGCCVTQVVSSGDLFGVSITELAELPYVGNTSPAAYESVNNKVYFLGGYSGAINNYTDRIRVFDLDTLNWSELGFRMPYPIGGASRGIPFGDHFYVTPEFTTGEFNGWGSHNRLIDVDLGAGVARETVAFPNARIWDMLSCGANGKLYVFGGHTGSDYRTIFEYVPGGASVSPVGTMQYVHRAGAVTLGADGWMYIMGWSSQIERFNPVTRAVQTMAATLPASVYGVRQLGVVWHIADENAIYFTGSARLGNPSHRSTHLQIQLYAGFLDEHEPLPDRSNLGQPNVGCWNSRQRPSGGRIYLGRRDQ